MIVVQVHEHRGERQTLDTTFMRAAFRHLVEAAKQPLEMIRNQFPVLARQVIHGVVDRAERARPAFFVEVTAEALGSTRGAGANVIRQLALFSLELGYHGCPPEKDSNCSAAFT